MFTDLDLLLLGGMVLMFAILIVDDILYERSFTWFRLRMRMKWARVRAKQWVRHRYMRMYDYFLHQLPFTMGYMRCPVCGDWMKWKGYCKSGVHPHALGRIRR